MMDDPNDLDALISALPDTMEPSRDLWPEIEARMTLSEVAPAPRRSWSGFAMAAAVLIGLTAAATAWLVNRTEAPVTPEIAAIEDVVDAPAEDTAIWRTEMKAADATLAEALDERRDTIDPEILLVIEQNLAIIDNAMADIDAAMAASPQDPALRAALIDAWRQRIALLERARILSES